MQKHGGTVMAPEKEKQKKNMRDCFFQIFSIFLPLSVSLKTDGEKDSILDQMRTQNRYHI